MKKFYAAHFTRDNVIIGLAGGMPAGFADRVKADFAKNLPAGKDQLVKITRNPSMVAI